MTSRSLPILALALGVTLALCAAPARAQATDPAFFLGSSTITTSAAQTDCNFNGTAIPCPDYVWFIAVGKLMTPALAPITIYMQNQHITFTANSINYNLLVPDGATTFDASATTATTAFAGGWVTTVPLSASGNQFFAALAFPVPCPAGLPGSIHPVSWSADFFASKPGATVDWTWSAAAYTNFSTAYNTLGVKATDANGFPPFTNSDHAGTPENFKSFVTGGATGGGGSNFTGSLCSTHSVPNLPVPVRTSTWGGLKQIYR